MRVEYISPKLVSVEKAIAKDRISLAITNYNTVYAQNTIEDSYKLYYASYINYKNGVFNSTDSLCLVNLAHGCPQIQGNAVSMAAALYNVIYYEAVVFANICPEFVDKSMKIGGEYDEPFVESYCIYPVPNNGVFHLLGDLNSGSFVQIFDFNGKLVYNKTIETTTTDELLETHLHAGTFTVVLKNSAEEELFRTKTIIIP